MKEIVNIGAYATEMQAFKVLTLWIEPQEVLWTSA